MVCSGSPPRAWGRRAGPVTPSGHVSHGSPPRAWGRRLTDTLNSHVQPRFTPTCVGTAASTAGRLVGSPPRAWGRLQACDRPAEPSGDGAEAMGLGHSVHPHVRGDGVPVHGELHPHVRGDGGPSVLGSPPRAWGRRRERRYVTAAQTWRSVHPHVRGDGQQAYVARGAMSRRFTPTCVGTARAPSGSVHPHVRGDGRLSNYPSFSQLYTRFGSPPRAWGRPGSGAA